MEKNIEIALLYEFYGNLLTEKQSNIIELYYNDDLSLSEIAQSLNITRQGVRKHIKDAQIQLFNYEEKLKLMKKFLENKSKLKDIYNQLEKLESKYNDEDISKIKSEINNLI